MMLRFLITVGIGVYTYYNRMVILKYVNHWHRWLIKIDCLNPSYVDKTVDLNNFIYYHITLRGRKFITRNKEYNLEKYDVFRKKMAIPNSPDNILEADIILNDDTKIDVLYDVQLLCGPYVDQCTQENKDWIFNYLADEYTELESASEIKELTVELINGDSIKLT